jgi:hypothetical protein
LAVDDGLKLLFACGITDYEIIQAGWLKWTREIVWINVHVELVGISSHLFLLVDV